MRKLHTVDSHVRLLGYMVTQPEHWISIKIVGLYGHLSKKYKQDVKGFRNTSKEYKWQSRLYKAVLFFLGDGEAQPLLHTPRVKSRLRDLFLEW